MTSNVELVFQESMRIEEESIYAHLLEEKTQDRIVIKVMIEMIYLLRMFFLILLTGCC